MWRITARTMGSPSPMDEEVSSLTEGGETRTTFTFSVSEPRRCQYVSCRCVACVSVLCTMLAFGVLVGTSIHGRGRLLEPMLDMLEKSAYCHHTAAATCLMELPDSDLRKFDLNPPLAEKVLMGFVYMQIARRDREIMRQILSGAHILLQRDVLSTPGGENFTAYQLLQSFPGAYKRQSSHRSDAQQYGLPQGEVLHTLLLGDIDGHTWFQFEGNGVHSVISFLLHMGNYVEYKLTGRNIGPLGTSKFTDRAPLVIKAPVSLEQKKSALLRVPAMVMMTAAHGQEKLLAEAGRGGLCEGSDSCEMRGAAQSERLWGPWGPLDFRV